MFERAFKLLGREAISIDKVGLRRASGDQVVAFAKREDIMRITKVVKMSKKCDLASIKHIII